MGTAYTSVGNGSFFTPELWNPFTERYPGQASGDSAVVSHAMTFDNSPAYPLTTLAIGAGAITISGTRALTVTGANGLSYSGTSTSGGVIIPAGNSFALTGGGAGTTALLNTGAGYGAVPSGTGVLQISNPNGTAVAITNGRGVSAISLTSTTNSISGATAVSMNTANGPTYGIFLGAGTWSVSGTLYAGPLTLQQYACIYMYTTVNFNGTFSNGGVGYNILVLSGTLTWTGTHTIAAGDCGTMTVLQGSTVNFGLEAAPLDLTVAGLFFASMRPAATVNKNYFTYRKTSADAKILFMPYGVNNLAIPRDPVPYPLGA